VTLAISLAGRTGLEVDGVPVSDQGLGPLGRVALAYLVTERSRPVDRHELAEVLWAEDLPATWASALRTHLAKLRAVLRAAGLGEDALVAARGCYQLRVPDAVVVDLEGAEAALAEARAALAEGDAETARSSPAAAATVAGRQFLPGKRTRIQPTESVGGPLRPLARPLERLRSAQGVAGRQSPSDLP
jgi:DNA-binding SARP family transcriptional activator